VTARLTIGVIGLGGMGRPMARRLAAAGHAVCGFDISSDAMAAAAREGIEPANDLVELAARCELAVAMVWDDRALREVICGPHGLAGSARLPQCVLDLSTTSVGVARELAQTLSARGSTFLDGAVIGGGVAAAKAGTSPIVVAGDRACYERYLPALCVLGKCSYVGTTGNAKAVKILNNLLVGVITAANGEALSLGLAMGQDLGRLVGWLRPTLGGSRVLDTYMGRYVEEGIYAEGLIGHRLMAKDMQLAGELAETLDCASVFARPTQQMYLAFGRALGPDRPFPSAFEYFRDGARASAAPSNP
jgi:3-hydroxyisobutyrate dehydrogenase-like beta-hydroxyacid dehydrogenase